MCLSRWNFPGLISQPYWNRTSMRCFRIGKALRLTAKAMVFLLRAFYCFTEGLLPAQKADTISSQQGTDSVWRGRVPRPLGEVHDSAGRSAEYNRWSSLSWHGLSFRVQLCKQTWCCPYPQSKGDLSVPLNTMAANFIGHCLASLSNIAFFFMCTIKSYITCVHVFENEC